MTFLRRLTLGSALLIAPIALAVACTSGPETSTTSTHSELTSPRSLADRGGDLVNQLGCHGCHDSNAGIMAGNNDGVLRTVGNAGRVMVYPANLTPDSKTGLGSGDDGWSDDQIARAVRTGVDDECLTLCKVMPQFDLDDDQMAAVIAYLRSLTPVENAIDTQGCPTLDPSTSGAGQFVDAGSCPARGR